MTSTTSTKSSLTLGICLAVCTGISAVLGTMSTSEAMAFAAAVFALVLLAGVIWSVWVLHRRACFALAWGQELVSTQATREELWVRHLNGLMGEACDALVHLLEAQLPATWAGEPVPEWEWGHEDLKARLNELFGRAVDATQSLHQEHEHKVEALRLVVVALMQRASASAHRVEAAADYLARQSGVSDWMVEQLMRITHEAAQQARTAQSPLVLCGERPGQSWQKPVPLAELVQSASARISDYTRITSIGDPDLAAKPAAAESLIHLLAEVLANATQCSAPALSVQVHIEVVQSGATITIDDKGVGMTERRLQEIREIASGRRPVALTDLGAAPQTGLAVVGTIARRLGLTVDLRPSAYGGIQAIVLIPGSLLERVQPVGVLPSAEVPLAETLTATVTATASGLPVRRRSAAGPEPTAAPASGPWTAADPQIAASWMERFLGPAFDPDLREGAGNDC